MQTDLRELRTNDTHRVSSSADELYCLLNARLNSVQASFKLSSNIGTAKVPTNRTQKTSRFFIASKIFFDVGVAKTHSKDKTCVFVLIRQTERIVSWVKLVRRSLRLFRLESETENYS